MIWLKIVLFFKDYTQVIKMTSSYIRLKPYKLSQNIWGKLYFFCEVAHYGKSSISIFQDFFASTNKIFISGGGLSTKLSSMKV